MIRVQFVKVWRMYQPGEFAGFDTDLARQIVAGGFACAVDPVEAEPMAKAKAKTKAGDKGKADTETGTEAEDKGAEHE
jgi:hypothetical protein